MKVIICFVFALVVNLTVYAQTSKFNEYNQSIIEENFDDENTRFKTQSNENISILMKDGDLVVTANNFDKEFRAFSDQKIEVENYKIKSAFKLSSIKNKKSYFGFLLNTSEDGESLIAIEFNAKKQYRIRHIIYGISKYVSGKASNEGWVNCKKMNKSDQYNYIDIISNMGKYELYVNFEFISTHEVSSEFKGNYGISIGPSSNARVDFIHILSEKVNTPKRKNQQTNQNIEITTLKEKITALKKENQNSQSEIIALTSNLSDVRTQLNESESYVNSISTKNLEHQTEIDKLKLNISEKEKQISKLESNKEQLDLDISKLNSEIVTKNNSIRQLNSEFTKAKSDYKIMLSSKESEINLMNDKLNKIEQASNSKIKTKNNEIQSLSNQIKEQISSVNSLKESNTKLSIKINEKDASTKELKRIIFSKNELDNQQKKEIQSLKNLGRSSTKKINDLENSKGILLADLNKKNANIDDLKSKLTTQIASENQLKKVIQSLEEKIQQLEEKERELEQVQNQLEEEKNRNNSLTKDNEILSLQIEEQKIIAAKFAEVYRYEKEKNKVLQEEILAFSNATIPTTSTNTTNFRVQLGIFDEPINTDQLEGLTTINTKNNQFIYLSEKFNSYLEARSYLIELNKKGFKSAYIVKF